MTPSSDQLHESQPSEVQSQENNASKQGPRDRPVVQALWHMARRGAEALCKTLTGSEREGSDEGMPQQDSISEEMYFPCYEVRGVRVGPKTRYTAFIQGMYCCDLVKRLYLQSSGCLERSFSLGDTDVRMYPNSWRPYLSESEEDAFINIKLSAIRQAFELILRDPEAKHFLKETGKSLIGGLLSLAGKSSEGFSLVWEKLMAFTENPTNWPDIVDECQEAGMHTVGFYDIFYESIVLKVLECQEYIPAILKPTLRTPWISEGTKKTTVMFYAWSQIKKKRECLMRPDALYHHLYEVFDYTDPVILWAAYGPQSKTKEFYILLRGRILSFIQQMFSLDRKKYESPESLAVKVLSNWKRLVRFLQFFLDENKHNSLPVQSY
ncbi:unnamed protein product [Oncorhynchus mykiss]|uniref:Uncharacterized protein n=1 Tax=Oncorhynchus mykiss TaxID=8022 RepID=A0A060W1H4_ONCMY|nr:unnamed protein product [Oncorhynchus mykiss]